MTIQNIIEKFDKDVYACRSCGISLSNRPDWCDLGCGRDYNQMYKITNIKSFIQSSLTELLDSVNKTIDEFVLFDWSGEAEVYAEIERLKQSINQLNK